MFNCNDFALILKFTFISIEIYQTSWRTHWMLLLWAIISCESPLDQISVRLHQYILTKIGTQEQVITNRWILCIRYCTWSRAWVLTGGDTLIWHMILAWFEQNNVYNFFIWQSWKLILKKMRMIRDRFTWRLRFIGGLSSLSPFSIKLWLRWIQVQEFVLAEIIKKLIDQYIINFDARICTYNQLLLLANDWLVKQLASSTCALNGVGCRSWFLRLWLWIVGIWRLDCLITRNLGKLRVVWVIVSFKDLPLAISFKLLCHQKLVYLVLIFKLIKVIWFSTERIFLEIIKLLWLPYFIIRHLGDGKSIWIIRELHEVNL